MDNEIKSIILGMVLGDSHINKNNGYLQFNHSEKQYDYLMYKMELLKEFDPKFYRSVSYHKDVDKSYNQVRFYIKADSYIKKLRKKLYDNNGVKKITINILKKLTPHALAIWYCDDGGLHYKYRKGKVSTQFAYLNTQCFSYIEHELLQYYFKEYWDIDVVIHKNKGSYRLYFNNNNIKKFIKIISDYIPECMNYKKDLKHKPKLISKNHGTIRKINIRRVDVGLQA